MKLKTISALCLASTTLFAASTAMAWESGNHSTSASVALTTDYMWRGYSQTDYEFAIQGSFDYSHTSGFYAGTWASNIDYDDDAPTEIDLYAGMAGETAAGIGWDFGALRYVYPGESYDWNEYYGSLSYSYFSFGIAYGNDLYKTGEDGIYYSLGFDYDLPMGVAFSAGVGYYDYDEDYYGSDLPDTTVDYRVGLSKEMAGFGFDLTYAGTDSDGKEMYGDKLAEGRLVLTISKTM